MVDPTNSDKRAPQVLRQNQCSSDSQTGLESKILGSFVPDMRAAACFADVAGPREEKQMNLTTRLPWLLSIAATVAVTVVLPGCDQVQQPTPRATQDGAARPSPAETPPATPQA